MAHFKYIKIIINIVSLIETLLSKFQKVQKIYINSHYKKIELLQQVCHGSCENCRYMSHIAVLFWLATVDEIYC